MQATALPIFDAQVRLACGKDAPAHGDRRTGAPQLHTGSDAHRTVAVSGLWYPGAAERYVAAHPGGAYDVNAAASTDWGCAGPGATLTATDCVGMMGLPFFFVMPQIYAFWSVLT
jgi:hypothetical protein